MSGDKTREAPGVLYVVATPIGNLEDVSPRVRRTLEEVAHVAAEDTRRTRALLSSLGIQKPISSYYEPREEEAIPGIIRLLEEGKDVALVTDGGSPAVSDPGYRLVKACARRGIKTSPIPGPSALTAAVSVSGLPSDRVTFAGFLPAKSGARKRALEELADRRDALVFFESPRRTLDFLEDALAVLGDREAVLFRELTKMHEERIGGTLGQIIKALSGREIKGEVTVVIGGAKEKAAASQEEVENMVLLALDEKSHPPSRLASEIARKTGWKRQEVYDLIRKIQERGD